MKTPSGCSLYSPGVKVDTSREKSQDDTPKDDDEEEEGEEAAEEEDEEEEEAAGVGTVDTPFAPSFHRKVESFRGSRSQSLHDSTTSCSCTHRD